MPPSPLPARTRLIAAGERLFAERGIDNVSLRELSRAAGSKNVMALQHHFTDRDGLLDAILQKHQVRIEQRRHRLLDRCEQTGEPALYDLAAALVEPWARCLTDDDGGRHYLRIFSELINRPRPLIPDGLDEVPGSIQRWRALVDPLLDAQQRRLHRRYAAMLYVTTELARWARHTADPDITLISSSLTDLVVAMLTAPVSAATSAALQK